MKKTIIALALAALACSVAVPATLAAPAGTATESTTAGSSVSIYYFGKHVKTKSTATVESTSDGIYVTYRGDTYKARPSDRDGFQYMFYADKTWYFNY